MMAIPREILGEQITEQLRLHICKIRFISKHVYIILHLLHNILYANLIALVVNSQI